MPSLTTYLTINQAAQQHGLSGRTLRYHIAIGELPAVKLPGRTGAYMITRRDLNHYLARRRKETARKDPTAS